MGNVVVVGTQWGDEGKGKIVDWLSSRADIVARFQGGHNAGHTLVIDGQVHKLSLLPSGILRSGKFCVIGNGVVIDPWALLDEIERLRARGIAISPQNLMIAENAALILPLHVGLDNAREAQSKKAKIGTTGRGIGPAYEDKIGRRAIRVGDLKDEQNLDDRLDRLYAHHGALYRGLGVDTIDRQTLREQLKEITPRLLPFCGPVWRVLHEAQMQKQQILFEGAQGTLLDVDFGTYPFVTSSNTLAAMAATGTGTTQTGYNLGIVKAYTTRVGSGPFPSELFDETGAHLAKIGKEKGTVTGRNRRCGWFDAALVRKSCILSGINGIALTKLDVLDDLERLNICTGYRIDGTYHDYLPVSTAAQMRAEPVYEELPGWKCKTAGLRDWTRMPAAAIAYMRRIEELTGCKIAMLSTSPERDDTILFHDPFSGDG